LQVENEADYCECSFWSNRAVRNEGNVILQKVKEVTTVRARWMVTFVEDLLPFERFLNKTKYYRCSLTSCPQIPGDTCALQSGKKEIGYQRH
jgi:hypothetical protein